MWWHFCLSRRLWRRVGSCTTLANDKIWRQENCDIFLIGVLCIEKTVIKHYFRADVLVLCCDMTACRFNHFSGRIFNICFNMNSSNFVGSSEAVFPNPRAQACNLNVLKVKPTPWYSMWVCFGLIQLGWAGVLKWDMRQSVETWHKFGLNLTSMFWGKMCFLCYNVLQTSESSWESTWWENTDKLRLFLLNVTVQMPTN